MRLRQFVCTIHLQGKKPLDVLPRWEEYEWLKRVTYQLEEGDETGCIHWQVFIQMENLKTKKQVAKLFREGGEDVIHVAEPKKVLRKGKWICPHVNAGRAYCHKNDCVDGHRYEWVKGGKQTELALLRRLQEDVTMVWRSMPLCPTKSSVMKGIEAELKYLKEFIKT